MSSAANLKTRCPVCNQKYQVAITAAGRKAKCPQCDTVFRVPAITSNAPVPSTTPNSPAASRLVASAPLAGSQIDGSQRPPTEDDILSWLSDGADQNETPQPRVVRQAVPVPRSNSQIRVGSALPTGGSGAPISVPGGSAINPPSSPGTNNVSAPISLLSTG